MWPPESSGTGAWRSLRPRTAVCAAPCKWGSDPWNVKARVTIGTGTLPCPTPAEIVTKGVDLEVGEVQILIEIEEAGDKAGQNSRGGGREGLSIRGGVGSVAISHCH